MAVVEKTVLIEHSAREMFDLVDRCEDYPAFLPRCGRTELKFRDELRTVATLHINYHSVRSSFTTENTKESGPRWKSVWWTDPFVVWRSWRFKALAETACKIEFRLHYEFSSKMFEKSSGRCSATSPTPSSMPSCVAQTRFMEAPWLKP